MTGMVSALPSSYAQILAIFTPTGQDGFKLEPTLLEQLARERVWVCGELVSFVSPATSILDRYDGKVRPLRRGVKKIELAGRPD